MLDLYSLLSLMIVSFLTIVLFLFYEYKIDKQLYSKSLSRNKPDGEKFITESKPAISVVIPITNQNSTLKDIIPVLFNQKYDGRFEVIVINQETANHVANELDKLKEHYEKLRSISISNTLKHISLRKLAITLGVKSVRNEWVILLNPDTIPSNLYWLKTFASQLTDDVDMVSAYYNYTYDDEHKNISKRLIFDRIKDFNLKFYALAHHVVLGCNDANFAIRKKSFLDSEGFSDCLELSHSEFDVLAANKIAPERMRYVYSSLLLVDDFIPLTQKELKTIKLRKIETICYLKGDVLKYFTLDYLASTLYSIIVIGFIIYFIVYSAYAFNHEITLQDFNMNLILLLEVILFIYLSSYSLRKTLKIMQEEKCMSYAYIYRFVESVLTILVIISYIKNKVRRQSI